MVSFLTCLTLSVISPFELVSSGQYFRDASRTTKATLKWSWCDKNKDLSSRLLQLRELNIRRAK